MTEVDSHPQGVTGAGVGAAGVNGETKSGPQHKVAVVERSNNTYSFHPQTNPLPIPGPSELLVKLSCTGICGSDISLASGVLGPTLPILGHEGIGRVVAHGSAIPPESIPLGTRVGVAWIRNACGTCPACLSPGGETRCTAHIVSGRAVDGTFAEYCIVPLSYVTRIPEGPKDELLAPILCGGVTIYKALKICGAHAGQFVVISGAGGGLGALGIQYARAMGLRIIAIDAGAEKGDFCRELGAETYIDVLSLPPSSTGDTCTSPSHAVMEYTSSLGATAVIVCSGSPAAYQEGLAMLSVLGTLVCVGIPPPAGTVTWHPHPFIDKGISIIGSAVGTRGDVIEACGFVERGVVKPVVRMVEGGLEGLDGVARLYKEGKAVGKFVMRFCEDDKEAMLEGHRERVGEKAVEVAA